MYGACRHKMKFHRLISTNKKASTDDRINLERVNFQALDSNASVIGLPLGPLNVCKPVVCEEAVQADLE